MLRNSLLVVVSLLISFNCVFGQDDYEKSSYLFVQSGYFQARQAPSVDGFRALDVGYFRSVNARSKGGFEIMLHRGFNDEVEEFYSPLDTMVRLRGGSQAFLEIEANLLYLLRLKSFNNSELGLQNSFGANFERKTTNPDPYGSIIEQRLYSIRGGVNPYFILDVYRSLSLFADFSFMQVVIGYDTYDVQRLNSKDTRFSGFSFSLEFFNYFHVGLQHRIGK